LESHLFKYSNTYTLESGESLPRFQLQYSTLGTLNEAKDNVVWVCHALTANAEADDWWEGLVGDGKIINPDKHFIICANIFGSCYGSSSPLDTNPVTQDLYLGDFPQYTVRDIVGCLVELRKHLEIDKISLLIGGSMGGMQALEWAIIEPQVPKNLILLATNAQHSPWGIAFNESQRMALEADSTWGEHRADAGKMGLRAARAIALLSYRDYQAYWKTQSDTDIEKTDHYKAQSYQQYQGDKLVERFNAHSYYFLSKAMDSHHIGRGRESVEQALKKVKSRTLCIGISSDYLFPTIEQKTIAEGINQAQYAEINSFYGHDGFLIEAKAITEIMYDFFDNHSIEF